jgi:drug/metabolite transporter (DMT)-like permease
MLGIFFGVLAAACFGFNNVSARRGVLSGTALQGLAISLPIGIVLFGLLAWVFGQWSGAGRMTLADVGFLAAAGFMHFVWGRYCNIRSLAAIGSNLAGPVQQVQLLLSLGLAIWLLGETLTPLKILGIILVVSAPAYILRARAKATAREKAAALDSPVAETAIPMDQKGGTKPIFVPRMAEGYACALLAAVGFGTSPILVKAGLTGTGLSLIGGFISCVAATIVVGAVLVIPAKFAELRGINRESLKWFTFSGVGVSFSHLFRYLALGLAPVTIVQPLQSMSLLFRMIFGYFVNREHERFDRYVIVGIIFSFMGAIALSLSHDAFLTYLELPHWLERIVRWQWP